MAYLLGVIITFRFSNHTFNTIALPKSITDGIMFDTDYAIGEHRHSALLLAHLKFGFLNTYALSEHGNNYSWIHMSSSSLIDIFVSQLGPSMWQRFIKVADTQSDQSAAKQLQIRGVTLNGTHIFITLAVDQGFFIYNSSKSKIYEIHRGPKGETGCVLPLTEPWPPIF
jgi:hypothetical protein